MGDKNYNSVCYYEHKGEFVKITSIKQFDPIADKAVTIYDIARLLGYDEEQAKQIQCLMCGRCKS